MTNEYFSQENDWIFTLVYWYANQESNKHFTDTEYCVARHFRDKPILQAVYASIEHWLSSTPIKPKRDKYRENGHCFE